MRVKVTCQGHQLTVEHGSSVTTAGSTPALSCQNLGKFVNSGSLQVTLLYE